MHMHICIYIYVYIFIYRLPFHIAASQSTLNVLKFLLEVDPESADEVTTSTHHNLLHCALNISVDAATMIAKVQYLCEKYPHFLHMSSESGYTPLQNYIANPLQNYITNGRKMDLSVVKIICQADKTVLTEICTNDLYAYECDGMLPLHLMLMYHMKGETGVTIASDIFRFILHRYPAAVRYVHTYVYMYVCIHILHM
jgi:hypothetical protein